jgi:hypothetical protein
VGSTNATAVDVFEKHRAFARYANQETYNSPMNDTPQPASCESKTRLRRWLLYALALVALLLVFFAYQQNELLIGWVNAVFC